MPNCEVCGTHHNHYNAYSREDGKYCSNACKQYAYRQRVKGNPIKKALLYDHNVTKKVAAT